MLTILKWYSIISIIIILITGLTAQLHDDTPKGYFITLFILYAPILFYLFTT